MYLTKHLQLKSDTETIANHKSLFLSLRRNVVFEHRVYTGEFYFSEFLIQSSNLFYGFSLVSFPFNKTILSFRYSWNSDVRLKEVSSQLV